MKPNLKLARKIVGSFTVNVKNNPEFLTENGTYCERNYLVAKCLLAIDELYRNL